MNNTNFIPELLPFKNIYNPNNFLGSLLKATENFTEFKSKLYSSELNPDYFLVPLLNQEAAASTRIEGTQVTTDEMYESQSNENSSEKNLDTQEAFNYMEALDYGQKYILERNEITKRLIKEMHVILMSNGVRGQNKNPGEFKNKENFIGKKGAKRVNAEFIPPGPEHTDSLIDNLLEYINSNIDDDKPLIKIAIIHAQFETIHPFMDGNGRVGRILIPLFLSYKKVIDDPIFFLSKNLEKNQFQYYSNLNATRWSGDWDKWIGFFQENISRQCKESIETIETIENLLREDLELLRMHHKHHQVSDYIKAVYNFPIFTIKDISNHSGISTQTCRVYTKTLLTHDRIFKNNMARNTRYYNYRFLEALR